MGNLTENNQEPQKDMKTRQREFMEQIFGKPTTGNIWGRKFTIFSIVFLSLMTAFVIWGVWSGNIDMKKQMPSAPDKWSEELQEVRKSQ